MTEQLSDDELAAIKKRHKIRYPNPGVTREQVRDDVLALLADLRQARAELAACRAVGAWVAGERRGG